MLWYQPTPKWQWLKTTKVYLCPCWGSARSLWNPLMAVPERKRQPWRVLYQVKCLVRKQPIASTYNALAELVTWPHPVPGMGIKQEIFCKKTDNCYHGKKPWQRHSAPSPNPHPFWLWVNERSLLVVILRTVNICSGTQAWLLDLFVFL